MVQGEPCPDIDKLSGMPYLSGADTWVDVPRLFGTPLTQPDKIRMFETDDKNWVYVAPLLNEMETVFSNASAAMGELYDSFLSLTCSSSSSSDSDSSGSGSSGSGSSSSSCSDNTKIDGHCCANNPSSGGASCTSAVGILREFNDALQLLALRTRQVRLLYEGSDPLTTHDGKATLLTESRQAIAQAQGVVRQREEQYRVPLERVGAWRENPTVYGFSYLWAVHSLYYWWRDQGLAERGSVQSHYSPCYMNRMDASEVAVGWGKYTLELLRSLIHYYSPDSSRNPVEIVNCIAAPAKEYSFPRDLYVY
jgi:hypothetical protein